MINDCMYWEKEEVFKALLNISTADDGLDWSIAALKAKTQDDWDWAIEKVRAYNPNKAADILWEVEKFQQEITSADERRHLTSPIIFENNCSICFKSLRLALSQLYQRLSLKTQQIRPHS